MQFPFSLRDDVFWLRALVRDNFDQALFAIRAVCSPHGPSLALRLGNAVPSLLRLRSGRSPAVKLAPRLARYSPCLAGLALPGFGSANDGTQRP